MPWKADAGSRTAADVRTAAGVRAVPGSRHAVGSRVDLDSFMTGLACVESSGRYEARNPVTGAYGKYQIMPGNWPSWAAHYLNNRWALPTPRNQEYIARQRIIDLYELRGRWKLVAHWWLTGSADPDESLWSPGSARYVGKVMITARYAASPKLRDQVRNSCSPQDLGDPYIRTTPWPRVKITGGRVYLRSAPGYENWATGYARKGQVFAALGSARDSRGKVWLRIGLHDGSTAWVAEWFTRPTGRR